MRPKIPDDHPIIEALRRGDSQAVRSFLDAGVDLYANGLISGAIGSGNVDIVQAFLDHEWGHCSRINKLLARFENAEQFSAWLGNHGLNIQEPFTM